MQAKQDMYKTLDQKHVSQEETMKTTVRSQKSGSQRSRRTTSIRSLKRSQKSNRASEVQTNEMYVIGGSLETVNINYKVDRENKRVQQRATLN